ncbi:hypothetical protein AB0I49_36310 [Streptomyces sp. NPDC050617]|uniref:hypothetical protein n=1 Tax=Streptomyces sp. NPDC050617 TaxID=3154628 RepID=UPI00341CB455
MTTPPREPGPPLPRKRWSRGKTIAFAVVVVIAVLVAVFSITGKSKDNGQAHKLSTPQTLEKGAYSMTRSHKGGDVAGLQGGKGPGMHDMTGVSGSYAKMPRSTQHSILNFDGAYGTVSDPHRALSGLLTYMQDSGEGDVAVPAKETTPTGASSPVTCEVTKTTGDNGKSAYLPMCAWADSGTVGVVAENDFGRPATSADAVDLDTFARKVDAIREEIRS